MSDSLTILNSVTSNPFYEPTILNHLQSKISSHVKLNMFMIAKLLQFLNKLSKNEIAMCQLNAMSKKYSVNTIINTIITTFIRTVDVKLIKSNKYNEHNKSIEPFDSLNNLDSLNGLDDKLTQQNMLYTEDLSTRYNIVSYYGITETYKIQRILNEKALYERNYITFNISNAIFFGPTYQSLQWKTMENATYAENTAVTLSRIRNIVSMRLYPMRLVSNPQNDIAGQYKLQINEFSAQSFVGYSNLKYHYLLNSDTYLLDSTYYNPYNNNYGIYKFDLPFTELPPTFTFTFINNFTNNTIAKPVLTYSFVYYPDTQTVFTPFIPIVTLDYTVFSMVYSVSPTTLTTISTDVVETGDTIVIYYYPTNIPNSATQLQLNNLTRLSGFVATKTSSTTFTIPADTNLLSTLNNGSTDITLYPVFINLSRQRYKNILLEITSLKNLDDSR